MRVLKWDVPVDDQPHRIGGGKVVHVACQDPNRVDLVQVWTVEQDSNDYVYLDRVVQIFGTGHRFNYGASTKVLGTAICANGSLVWHVVQHN